jgi:NADPH:quinone reductase-like Zn-dependent oxidoreductase
MGNAAVVRVLAVGADVKSCKAGDACMIVPNGSTDEYGNTIQVIGYDFPGIMGTLAKRVVWPERAVIRIGRESRYSIERWAGFPIRFTTAWDNWNLAYGTWLANHRGKVPDEVHVWGWGGGVALAQLMLAKAAGFNCVMIASRDARLKQAEALGIKTLDRRTFPDLNYDEDRWREDRDFRAKYHKSEVTFLQAVRSMTNRKGVSIFIDNIGTPVFHATMAALGRLGLVTTCGWKRGKPLSYFRPGPCVQRQILVHSHGCPKKDGIEASEYAEEHEWLPPAGAEEYAWEDIPKLADDYVNGRIDSYFPVYHVNPV